MRFKIQDYNPPTTSSQPSAGPLLRFKILINVLLILGLFLPSFSFALPNFWAKPEAHIITISSKNFGGFAQNQPIQPPETLEEAKELGEKALEVSKKELPGVLEKIWKEEVLPIWQKMYDWFKINIWPKIESWFKREIEPRAKEEIEKRKPIIEEEFKKEKEELKEEVPKVTKSLWEKFKELIK